MCLFRNIEEKLKNFKKNDGVQTARAYHHHASSQTSCFFSLVALGPSTI